MSTYTETTSFEETDPELFIERLQSHIDSGWSVMNIEIKLGMGHKIFTAHLERVNMG